MAIRAKDQPAEGWFQLTDAPPEQSVRRRRGTGRVSLTPADETATRPRGPRTAGAPEWLAAITSRRYRPLAIAGAVVVVLAIAITPHLHSKSPAPAKSPAAAAAAKHAPAASTKTAAATSRQLSSDQTRITTLTRQLRVTQKELSADRQRLTAAARHRRSRSSKAGGRR